MVSLSNIAFVLVPGSFSGPPNWSKVTERLTSKGYTVNALDIPSAAFGSPLPAANMTDDAQHIRNEVTKLLDSGKDVVLAMNSYGGISGSQSLQGLSRAERGKGKTAVTALVYVSAILVPVGMSSNDRLGAPPPSPNNDPYLHLNATTYPSLIFSDLPPAQQQYYFSLMPPQSASVFAEPLTYPGYLHVPATYILPEADKIIPPATQVEMVDAVDRMLEGEKKGRKVRRVLVPGSGHVAMLSHPDTVVEVLVEAAEGRRA